MTSGHRARRLAHKVSNKRNFEHPNFLNIRLVGKQLGIEAIAPLSVYCFDLETSSLTNFGPALTKLPLPSQDARSPGLRKVIIPLLPAQVP